MEKKLQRLLAILARLDMDTQSDLIDEAICFFIDKGVDVTIDLDN